MSKAAPSGFAEPEGAEAEDLGSPNVNDSGLKHKKTFKSDALHLWDMGYNPIPCRGKIPAVKNWTSGAANREQVEAWAKLFPNHNVGIVNTPALDVDCRHEGVVADLLKVLRWCYGLT